MASLQLRAVLIDLDGTLVDRDAALRRWLAHEGHPAARIDAALDEGSPSLGRVIAGLGSTDARALAARIREQLPEHIPRDEAVLAALDRLADAGLRLALVSNGGSRTQRAKLAAAGIDSDRFDCVLISAECGVAKPERRIFARALSELRVSATAAIMIGDSPIHDIAGAAAAGLASCWIARGRSYSLGSPRPTLEAPDFVAAVDEILALDNMK